MPLINRDAIVVKPKAPFFYWLKKIYFPETPPQKLEENKIYLLQENDTEKDLTKYLKKHFDRIFCSELWSWHTDEKDWPQNRTYKMFIEWFEVEIHCMIHDMERFPVDKD